MLYFFTVDSKSVKHLRDNIHLIREIAFFSNSNPPQSNVVIVLLEELIIISLK